MMNIPHNLLNKNEDEFKDLINNNYAIIKFEKILIKSTFEYINSLNKKEYPLKNKENKLHLYPEFANKLKNLKIKFTRYSSNYSILKEVDYRDNLIFKSLGRNADWVLNELNANVGFRERKVYIPEICFLTNHAKQNNINYVTQINIRKILMYINKNNIDFLIKKELKNIDVEEKDFKVDNFINKVIAEELIADVYQYMLKTKRKEIEDIFDTNKEENATKLWINILSKNLNFPFASIFLLNNKKEKILTSLEQLYLLNKQNISINVDNFSYVIDEFNYILKEIKDENIILSENVKKHITDVFFSLTNYLKSNKYICNIFNISDLNIDKILTVKNLRMSQTKDNIFSMVNLNLHDIQLDDYDKNIAKSTITNYFNKYQEISEMFSLMNFINEKYKINKFIKNIEKEIIGEKLFYLNDNRLLIKDFQKNNIFKEVDDKIIFTYKVEFNSIDKKLLVQIFNICIEKIINNIENIYSREIKIEQSSSDILFVYDKNEYATKKEIEYFKNKLENLAFLIKNKVKDIMQLELDRYIQEYDYLQELGYLKKSLKMVNENNDENIDLFVLDDILLSVKKLSYMNCEVLSNAVQYNLIQKNKRNMINDIVKELREMDLTNLVKEEVKQNLIKKKI